MEDEPLFDQTVTTEGQTVLESQQEHVNIIYHAEDIKEFLRTTKWQKYVVIEEFFPDNKQFIHELILKEKELLLMLKFII